MKISSIILLKQGVVLEDAAGPVIGLTFWGRIEKFCGHKCGARYQLDDPAMEFGGAVPVKDTRTALRSVLFNNDSNCRPQLNALNRWKAGPVAHFSIPRLGPTEECG